MLGRVASVLAIGAHTDDVELGAGATISRLVDDGVAVTIAAMGLGGYGDDVCDEDEAMAAAAVLGVQHVVVGDHATRSHSGHRQRILDELVRLNETCSPDLVIAPDPTDLHQDHSQVGAEVLRAFKSRTVITYRFPWNAAYPAPDLASLVVEVTANCVRRKIEALQCYQSQSSKYYMSAAVISSLARVAGASIGVDYGEAFFLRTVRWSLERGVM